MEISTESKDLIASFSGMLSEQSSTGSFDRIKLKNTAEQLSISLETPGDTAQRIAYYPVRTSIVRIAIQLNIFRILSASPTPLSSASLAEKVNADPILLQRLLRYLASMHVIGSKFPQLYFATSVTRNLTVPGLEAGIKHTFDTVGPPIMALPNFLAKSKYENPTDPRDCPFQAAFKTDEPLFEWFPKHPERLESFNSWMTAQREGRANWLDFFPFEKEVAEGYDEGQGEGVIFVDVGGAMGHEIHAVKERYPGLKGKFVLQDLPDTVAQALPVPGMVAEAHDFFTEQPVKGARVYYLRNILHDWPDDKCVEILGHIAKALKPGYSKILLNEMVIPNQDAEIIATQVDMIMMACLAACERTESHWRTLIERAGLNIEKIWTDEPGSESVIEIALK